MVASSAQQSAPVIVIKPATAQASNSQPGAPINRADSAEVMKMPDPIIEPMTIMVASSKPSPRTKLVCCCFKSSPFIVATPALQFSRVPIRAAGGVPARIPLLLECRRGHKWYRLRSAPRFRRSPALLLRAAFGQLARLLQLDREAMRPAASAERAIHPACNFDPRKLLGPFAAPVRPRQSPLHCGQVQKGLDADRSRARREQ